MTGTGTMEELVTGDEVTGEWMYVVAGTDRIMGVGISPVASDSTVL